MKAHMVRLLGVILLALFTGGAVSPSQADTGTVRVVFTKGGFIVGVGSGEGCCSSAAILIRSPSPA
jgi:hypothetical protein